MNKLSLVSLFGIAILLQNCSTPVNNYTEKTILEDSITGQKRAVEIRKNTAIELTDGLQVSLWASDSLAPDPIALDVDDFGKVYLTRTTRRKHSEMDIRGHRDWMTASISLQTVEDRRAFLRETFAPEKSNENSWLEDFNNDGNHDWHDLTVENEEVWRLEDQNDDGLADISTRILDDFHEEVSDVAGALLVRRNDMFVGVAPDMWRITDSNNDGKFDTKVSISHGFQVHIGFGGHNMSGAIEGPDGKIYWGIGDIGANIVSKDGKHFKYPNQGILVRSNPDGSDFEVFAAGLRNTHEFEFDKYGNIIGSDNDGDHPGEKERLMYIVEGSDAGWRTNWQFGKYTDPKNNSYKVWMDEKLFVPRWEGQAAYIIPPITNYHSGPAGMEYNPGTALGSKWKDKFFLVEFVGRPSSSPIWSFSLKPSGASFELDQEEVVFRGILPTGIHFGPDGALYIADWINGWGTKNYGRVWKLDVTEDQNDLAAERAKTKELMQLDYTEQSIDQLYELLFYEDMRIRKKAQFELVDRGSKGLKQFSKAVEQKEYQLARVHAIWGIGQLERKGIKSAKNLVTLLHDGDPEIVAQAAKVIGEVRYTQAGEKLIPLLENNSDRVKFFAAQAIGRIEYKPAVAPLIEMIRKNADEDVYLRHAAVLALSRIGEVAPIVALKDSPDKSLRMSAVLVLRRMGNENVALFLHDSDEYNVTDAARAINDDWSIEAALPELAKMLQQTKFVNEPLLRRAINAASRVGGNSEIDLLVDFTNREDVAPKLHSEALEVLGIWASPSVLDRVDGRLRGEISRDPAYVISKLKPTLENKLLSKENTIVLASINAISNLKIKDFMDLQSNLAQQHNDPEVRAAMITSLYKLKYPKIVDVVKNGINDQDEIVRTTALGLVSELEITKENLPQLVAPVFKKGSVREQQQLLHVLGALPIEKTDGVFKSLIDQWVGGKLNLGISLDLVEAVDSTKSDQLIKLIEPHRSTGKSLEDYTDVLYGGNVRNGAKIFYTNSTAQCVRCHTMDDKPGEVGPSLKGIANKLTREQILQALVDPSARLAPGYGTVNLTLSDGNTASGILMEENESELVLKTSEAEPLRIALKRIAKRENIPSSMPNMGYILTRREIRDVVAFLASQK